MPPAATPLDNHIDKELGEAIFHALNESARKNRGAKKPLVIPRTQPKIINEVFDFINFAVREKISRDSRDGIAHIMTPNKNNVKATSGMPKTIPKNPLVVS
jgi:hypothetical protein